MSEVIETTTALTTVCDHCGKPMVTWRTCGRCGKKFCPEHMHLLALAHTNGMDTVYACEDCIDREHLHVVDINHPYYMKGS